MANFNTLFKLLTLIFIQIQISLLRKKDVLDLPEESYQLVELEESNVDAYLSNDFFFLFIHNPWCTWSQKLHKKLTKINLLLKLEAQPFYIGLIDNTVYELSMVKGLPKLNDITYPKIMFFYKGEYVETYNDILDKNSIFNWIKKRIYSTQTPFSLPTTDVFNYKFKNTKHAMIFFPPDNELSALKQNESESLDDEVTEISEKSLFKIFSKVAEDSQKNILIRKDSTSKDDSNPCKDVNFFYTTNLELINKYRPTNRSPVAFFSNGNYTSSMNPEEITYESINEFCNKNTYVNLFKNFDENAVQKIFIQKNPALILFRNKQDNKTEYEEIKLETISYMYDRKLHIVITDIDEKYSYKLSNLLGVRNEDLPAIRLIDFKGKNNDMRNFLFSREVNSENILDFVQKWEEGYLSNYQFYSKPSHKKDNNKSSVVNISTNLFYEKVFLNSKNVLVFYYSEFCSHCKKHLPLFDLLSKKLNLILFSLVQIDVGPFYQQATGVKSIPSIVLYPSNHKENPIEFEGKINIKNVLEFIYKQLPNTKDDL